MPKSLQCLPSGCLPGLDPVERKAIFEELTSMVKAIAGRMAARLPKHADVDDLLSAGMIGLFEALERFDPTAHNDVRRFAAIRVKGAMLDELRAADPMGRSRRAKARELEREERDLGQTLGRRPSEQELAAHLCMDPEMLRAMMHKVQPVRFDSIDALAQDGQDVSSWITDRPNATPHEALEKKRLRELMEREFGNLKSKNHELALRFCFFDGMTNRELAKVIGVSESRASQLLSEALAIFGKRIRGLLRAEHGSVATPEGQAINALRGVRHQIRRPSSADVR